MYHPGKYLAIADTLSRAFLSEQSDEALEENLIFKTHDSEPRGQEEVQQHDH